MKSFHPIVLAAVFARAGTAAAATANANEPQAFSPTAAIIESELAIAQSQLGSGTRTSDVQAEEHGVLRKSGGGGSPGQGMLDKSGPGESPRWLRGDLDMFDMNMNLSGSGDGGSKSGKSKSGKAGSVAIAKPFPADGEELKAAVRDFVTQECAARNGTCFVAQQWGFPMNKWDVSQVTDMSGLFYDSQGLFEDFNEDITGWDTGSVTDMSFMFFEAREFNQNLADWNVAKVENTALMFKDAQSFNQDISNWKFDDIESMTSMLDGAKSFEQNLCAWGEQPAVQLALSSGGAKDIFRDSGCKLQVTPQNDEGPFCASCSDNGNGTDTNTLLLCRQVPGRPGFGLEEFDARYSPVAEPVFSKLTFKDANDDNEKLRDLFKDLTSTGSGGFQAFDVDMMKYTSATLAAASAALAVASFFLSKNEPDPTQEMLKEGFTQVYNAIELLSDQVSEGFSRVRLDLADIELDELMASLQAIHFAFQEMQDALNSTDMSLQVKKTYTDKYRAACNRPHFTPADIFRQFYGFACGNNIERDCYSNEGTGICKYGVKKRQYIFDIVVEAAKQLPSSVRAIRDWLLPAMLLAQFHDGACLPADAASCNDPATDPIRQKISNEIGLAFNETADNLNREVNCLQHLTFRDYLSGFNPEGPVFYTQAVPNESCFRQEGYNQCMAEKTKQVLEREYNDKEWTVIVYSSMNPGKVDVSKPPTVMSVCVQEEGVDYIVDRTRPKGKFGYDTKYLNGCTGYGHVKFEGHEDRWFHLMYRSIDSEPKDYSLEQTVNTTNGQVMSCSNIDVGDKTYNALPDLLRQEGVREYAEDTQASFCWAHPFFPGQFGLERTCHNYILRASHGYIALIDDKDIELGIALGNFTVESGTFFDGDQLLEEYERDDKCGPKKGGAKKKFRMFY